MLPSIRSAIALTLAGLVGCGGLLQKEDPSDGGITAKSIFSAPQIGSTSEPPTGTWELTSLDNEHDGSVTPTAGYFFIDFRSDGKAIALRCEKPVIDGNGTLRCANKNAYACFYGSLVFDGNVYRADIPDLRAAPNQPRGEISTESDRLVIRDILPTYDYGQFAPVIGYSPTATCIGP